MGINTESRESCYLKFKFRNYFMVLGYPLYGSRLVYTNQKLVEGNAKGERG